MRRETYRMNLVLVTIPCCIALALSSERRVGLEIVRRESDASEMNEIVLLELSWRKSDH